ncbi:unnamed protein product [Orchesella dallaii]|uniref:Metalloendopeptidase n=1 Tax=Orchesella dallaii TaxID=48710 RepID=A0ABP1R1U2_9HEXA
MKSCFKSLNIDPSDEHRKGVETSFDDKGVTLCAFTQMKMAKDDGTIDKDKLLAFLKIEDAEFPKLVESCSTKAESEFKDESDAAVKAKKKTTYFVVCLDRWLENAFQGIPVKSRGNEPTSFSEEIGLSGEKWPNGVVKYKLHASLTFSDIHIINKAFDEYHKKTCIRFKPWEEGDVDYVSIELDNLVCGQAHVCKKGGPQFAKFGKQCRNVATMVHQLGHTLCLNHEHQRKDRDRYVNFANCRTKPEIFKSSYYNEKGIYDYASQMHPTCQSCTSGGGWPTEKNVNCGSDITPGLSLLDVDTINSLYDCQGCHRHRWRPTSALIGTDWLNMYKFNYETLHADGAPLVACRAKVTHGELAPGLYNFEKQSCLISYYWEAYEAKSGVEVLTIPGGRFDAQCWKYGLVNSSVALENNPVLAGMTVHNEWFKFHIAYSKEKRAVGKAIWLVNEKEYKDREAEVVDKEGKSHTTKDFQILTCGWNSECKRENKKKDDIDNWLSSSLTSSTLRLESHLHSRFLILMTIYLHFTI